MTVIGAGPAGLSVAACLKRRGVAALLLEASEQVGPAWRRHYDRLHLHTHKGGSALPGLAFPSDYPRYPSREQFVAYLDGYARHFGLEPALGEAVGRIAREGDQWVVTTSKRQVSSKHVVVATGNTRVPVQPRWPGLDGFKGDVLHSSRYKNGASWQGKRVLVVGLGNSGGEIAIAGRARRSALASGDVKAPSTLALGFAVSARRPVCRAALLAGHRGRSGR